MGLYINEDQQGMFKHVGNIYEPNQTYFRRDYLQELLQEQQQIYQTINQKMVQLARTYETNEINQSNQFKKLNHRLDHMAKDVEVNGLTDEQLQKQVSDVSENNQKILQWMEIYNSDMKQMGGKIDQQITQQTVLTGEINKQQETQNNIVNRLESQEALTEKLLRQMDHFRALLYERTYFLAEQVENGYQLMATYIYKQLTGVEQPLTLLTDETGQESKVK